MKIEKDFIKNHLPDIVVCFDTQCRRIYVNSEWERLNNQPANSGLYKTPIEEPGVLSKTISKYHQKKLENVLKSGLPDEWNLEIENNNNNNKKEFYSIRAIPEYDKFDNVSCLLVTARNITKIKQKEQEKLDEQMSLFFEKDLIGMSIMNLKNSWIKANKKFCSMIGYSFEELQQLNWKNITHPDDLYESMNQFNQIIKGEIDEFTIKKRIIHKNSSIVYIKLSVSSVKNEDKTIKYLFALIEDITEQTKTQKKLEELNRTLEKQVNERTCELQKMLDQLHSEIEERKQQEEKYRTLVENIDMPIYRYNKELFRIYVNPAVEKLTGKSTNNLINKKIKKTNLVDEKYKLKIINSIQKVFKEKKGNSLEVTFTHSDGTKKYYIQQQIPEFSSNNEVETVLAIGHDITFQKKLIEREEKFRTLAENSPNIIMRYDSEAVRIYANPSFSEQTGIPMDLTKNNKPDLQWGIYFKMLNITALEYQERILKVIKTGKSDNIAVEWIRYKDSMYIAHDIHIVAEKNQDGKILGALAIGHNISKLREANKKLLLQQFALDHIHDSVFLINKDTSFEYVNKGAINALGYTQEEFFNLKVKDIVPDSWTQENWELFWEKLKKEKNLTLEVQNKRKNGTSFPVEIDISYIIYNNIEYHIAIARNITEQKKYEKQILEREKEFRTLAEHTPDTIARYDKKCIRTYANPAFCKIAGKTKEELLGKTPTHFINNSSVKEYEEDIKKVFKTGKESNFELTWKNAKDELMTSFIHIVPEYDEKGVIQSVLATGRDITKIKIFEKEIIKQKNFQDTLLEGIAKADLGVHVVENKKFIYTNNMSLAKDYGFDNSISSDFNFLEAIHPDDKEKISLLHEARLRGEDVPNTYTVSLLKNNGERREHEVSVVIIPNTKPIQSIAVTKDITEKINIEKRIEFMAHHDVLTKLPNRVFAKDKIEQLIQDLKNTDKKFAMLFVDLDSFKTINDSLGHSIGDEVLKLVAQRLSSCLRNIDIISRQGGDEFLIILPNIKDRFETIYTANKIINTLNKSFVINNHTLSTTASIGIALYPEHSESYGRLLQCADAAMYKAKDNGKNNYCIFNQEMQHNLIGLFKMQNDLKDALKNKEFVLYYQPQIDLSKNKIIAAEALIRWEHPISGMIPPNSFISIAESMGIIVEIGEWVIMEACKQAAAWAKEDKKILVAVNISAVQFKRGNLLKIVKDALNLSGLEPKYLELELTESILINDTENVLETVKAIKKLGVQLSIDDFGTGYSSLAYLKRFAVDKLKIDQSFIKEIISDKDDETIVKTIIQMAKSFNLKTIAEGVENKEILNLLKEFKCDEVQGYYFSKPIPSDKFKEYYENKFN